MRTYLKSHPHKIQKIEPVTLIPITFVELKVKQENKTYATFKTLLDSGSSSTLITTKAVWHLKKIIDSFNCVVGIFSNNKCNVSFKMAKFDPTATSLLATALM